MDALVRDQNWPWEVEKAAPVFSDPLFSFRATLAFGTTKVISKAHWVKAHYTFFVQLSNLFILYVGGNWRNNTMFILSSLLGLSSDWCQILHFCMLQNSGGTWALHDKSFSSGTFHEQHHPLHQISPEDSSWSKIKYYSQPVSLAEIIMHHYEFHSHLSFIFFVLNSLLKMPLLLCDWKEHDTLFLFCWRANNEKILCLSLATRAPERNLKSCFL